VTAFRWSTCWTSPTRYAAERAGLFEANKAMRNRAGVLAIYHSHPTSAPVRIAPI